MGKDKYKPGRMSWTDGLEFLRLTTETKQETFGLKRLSTEDLDRIVSHNAGLDHHNIMCNRRIEETPTPRNRRDEFNSVDEVVNTDGITLREAAEDVKALHNEAVRRFYQNEPNVYSTH